MTIRELAQNPVLIGTVANRTYLISEDKDGHYLDRFYILYQDRYSLEWSNWTYPHGFEFLEGALQYANRCIPPSPQGEPVKWREP